MWYANINPPTGNGETYINRPNIRITFAAEDTVDNPTNFSAEGFSSSQINLGWTKNSASDNVMIAYNTSNSFGTPLNGSIYSLGNNLDGGGTIIYNGDATSFAHQGLNTLTQYFYKAWSVHSYTRDTAYSPGITANATTLSAPIATFPYVQDFEDDFLPSGWIKTVSAGNDITQSATYNHTTGGSYSARFSSANVSSDYHQYLFSPEFTVTSENLRISFNYRKHDDSPEQLQFGIGTGTLPAMYNLVTIPLGYDGWKHVEINVPIYVGQNIRAGWHYYGNNLQHAYIDDFIVTENPPPSLISIAPLTWDYGLAGVGDSMVKMFTIQKPGGGIMDLSGVHVPCENWNIINPPTFPTPISNDNPLFIDVEYAPQSPGTHKTALIVTDEFSNSYLAEIIGSAYERPPGSTCENPLNITLPLENFSGNTEPYGNDYRGNWVNPNTIFLDGNDFVTKFVLYEDSFLSGSVSGSWTGITVTDRAPQSMNVAPNFASTGGEWGGSFTNVPLQAGTYFGIVSTRPEPQFTDFILSLYATSAPPEPVLAITPPSKDFGTVPVSGQSEPQTFTLKNSGGGTLVLDSTIQIGGTHANDFTLTDPNSYPINLEFGEETTVETTFNPEAAGERIAHLLVSHNADSRASVADDSRLPYQRSISYIDLTGWGLGTPEPDIIATADSLLLSWEPVPGALSYKVFSSADPYAWNYDEYITTATNTLSFPISGRRFFRILAIKN